MCRLQPLLARIGTQPQSQPHLLRSQQVHLWGERWATEQKRNSHIYIYINLFEGVCETHVILTPGACGTGGLVCSSWTVSPSMDGTGGTGGTAGTGGIRMQVPAGQFLCAGAVLESHRLAVGFPRAKGEPKETPREPKGTQECPKPPQGSPRRAKGIPRAPQREPKGVQGHPKGNEKVAQES